MVDLTAMILNEEDAEPLDIAGSTPLLKLASDYKAQRVDRIDIDAQLIGISKRLNSLPYSTVRDLLSFMFFSSTDPDLKLPKTVSEAYLTALQTSLTSPTDLHKRAEIVRFLASSGAYSLQSLQQETQVKDKYPWIWIDSLLYLHAPQRLIIEELEKLKGEKEFRQCLTFRLPLWKRRLGESSEVVRRYEPTIS